VTIKEKDRPARNGTGPKNTTNFLEHNHLPLHVASREVDWFSVHQFVMPLIERLGPLPWPGTVSWSELSDHDPRKLGAVLVAGMLWALNEDARQSAMAEAQRDLSRAYDWSATSRKMRARSEVCIPRRAS
jgi:hypothetical protein